MYRLLFGNYINGLGANFAKYVSHFQFETSYCGNSKKSLTAALHESRYDALIFFESSPDEKAIDFIRECRNEFPELKIYVIPFIDSRSFIRKAESFDNVVCMVAPVLESEICCRVAHDFYSDDEMPILPEVAGFLLEKGFTNGVIGFYHLGCAVTIVLRDRSMLRRVMTDLYPAAAEYMNTSPAHIERAIRVVGQNSFKRGVTLNGVVTNQRPPNKKLISILRKEYIKKNKNSGRS